jgi:predicted Zn finger-like uncharacterized protein
MYTQCPHCLTVHALTAVQIALGRGQLICGVCEQSFDGLERLADTPAQASVGYGRGRLAEPPRVLPEGMLAPADAPKAAPALGMPPPQFALQTGRRRRLNSGRWWALSAAMSLVLSTQIVLAQRAELSQDPTLRPWLQRLCSVAGCRLPFFSAPGQIALLNRDVSPHPSVAEALLITASFRNEAPWPQEWPVLELSMADLDGRLVALRRFTAAEYLGAAPDSRALLPGQPVMVELEIRDPGNEAIAFEFSFL